MSDLPELLKPSEVASMFKVDPKTVTKWAKAGLLTTVKTLGGHRRYLAAEVNDLLKERLQERAIRGYSKREIERHLRQTGEGY